MLAVFTSRQSINFHMEEKLYFSLYTILLSTISLTDGPIGGNFLSLSVVSPTDPFCPSL